MFNTTAPALTGGEFGLLFAFLSNDPATKQIDGEPAFSLDQGDVHRQATSKWMADLEEVARGLEPSYDSAAG